MQSTAPFFSNDVEGFIKLVVSLGALGGVVAAVIVKWGQSGFSKRLDTLETDINEVGRRVNILATECSESNARREELKARLDRREPIVDQLMKDIGAVESATSALEKADRGLQMDMITMIQASFKDRDTKIDALGINIARLQTKLEERESSRQIIREILEMKKRDSSGD